MATNAILRERIARKIMQDGKAIAIANPLGPDVDKVYVKEFDYHVPANATDIYVWYTSYTGNQANTAYNCGI